jgi:hypothetical protein
MKKRIAVLSVLAVAILFGATYLWAPGKVPAGQPPLATLSSANIGPFEAAFDADASAPRLVLLFSPT